MGNQDHGINVINEVGQVVLHVTVMVVVVMHAWTREVLEITSNQNSVEEWVALEEDVVDHQQVGDSVLLHPLEDLVLRHPLEDLELHHQASFILVSLSAQ